MRRRCCCKKSVPSTCFDEWDESFCGASNRPGEIVTATWSGGFMLPPPLGGYGASFSPSLTSGALELRYIGNTNSNGTGDCVWHGFAPVTISVPTISLVNYANCGGTITKSFSDIPLMLSARFGTSPGSEPYFKATIMMRSVYNGYFNPLTGNFSFPTPRYLATDTVDLADCQNTDCDGTVRPTFGPHNPLFVPEEFSFGAGRGPFTTIPPADVNCGLRTMAINIGSSGHIIRYLCLPEQFSCQTKCAGFGFSFAMSEIIGTLHW